MRSLIPTRPEGAGAPVRDPARAAALHRLAGATAGVPPRAPAATQAATADPATSAATSTVPWFDAAGGGRVDTDGDPDGRRPTRIPPEVSDTAAWADPPWWRRVRWAPDRVAGIALVVLVLALGGFSVHRLLAAVPEGPPVPDLPLAAPGEALGPAGDPPAPSSTPVEGGAGPGGAGGSLVVSVVGLVHRSGLVTLPAGARVADALDGAGGVLEGGDRDGLNLARRVADGEQILVGLAPGPDGPRGPRSGIVGAESPGASGAPGAVSPGGAAGTGAGPSPAGAGPVDLNAADATALDALPGVGPVTAAAILAWRGAHGRFTSVDQLAEVDGIGPATLAKLRPLVTV